MTSALRMFLRRLIPRRLRLPRVRAKAYLSLDPWLVEFVEREKFFYHAFRALAFNGISGDYVEFGCHGGMTFSLAYHESRRQGCKMRLWAFDSFCGLPSPGGKEDDHPKWRPGILATPLEEFYRICKSNSIPAEAYEVVPGFYDQTIGGLAPEAPPTDICLAYIDCDLYSSTKIVLEFLGPRLKHGMILAFDDYYCWSATQMAGERRALLEFFDNHDKWRLVPYIQYGWHGASFVIESLALDRAKSSCAG